MPSTYSPLLRMTEQATGENAGTWGQIVNTQFLQLIEDAVAGLSSISLTGQTSPYTLSANDGAPDQSRSAILDFTGTLTANMLVVTPQVSKVYFIANNTTGAFTLSVGTGAGGGNTLEIPQGSSVVCYTDATNYFTIATGTLSGTATGAIDMNNLLFDRPHIRRYAEVVANLGNSTGTVNIDYNAGNYQKMVMTGNVTLNPVNFPASGLGGSMTVKFVQDSTGSRTLSLPSSFKAPGGTPIELSTAPNAVDVMFFITDDGGVTYDYNILLDFA